MPTINRHPAGYSPQPDNELRRRRREVYQSKRWSVLRHMKLQQQPLCEKCEAEGYTVPAEHVHHVRSFVQENNPQMRRELAFRLSNLQSLCASCHGGIHSHRIDV